MAVAAAVFELKTYIRGGEDESTGSFDPVSHFWIHKRLLQMSKVLNRHKVWIAIVIQL